MLQVLQVLHVLQVTFSEYTDYARWLVTVCAWKDTHVKRNYPMQTEMW